MTRNHEMNKVTTLACGAKALLASALSVIVLFPAAVQAGTDIASLAEKITLDSAGVAQVAISIRLAKPEAGTLSIPTSFKKVSDLKVEGLPGATVALKDVDGARSFAITTEAAPPEKEPIRLTFTVPGFFDWKKEKVSDFGNRTLEYRFKNNLPTRVQDYSMELLLPPGYAVNTVDDSSPKLTSKTPVPPYKIVRSGDQYGIALKASKLGVGDSSFVKIRFKDGGKSTALLVLALAACALYLFGFRDLARSAPAA